MYDAILFPTDGSEGSTSARDHALELAADQGATLHALYVVEALSHEASVHNMVLEELTGRGEALVEAVAELGDERGVPVETAVLEGDPAATIVDYAEANGIDVIVMPTRGHSELTKAVLGSVTDEVIRMGTVPVVVTTLED